MTLTTCPACGGSVSKRAKMCPHCGESLVKKGRNLALFAIILVVLAAASLGYQLLNDTGLLGGMPGNYETLFEDYVTNSYGTVDYEIVDKTDVGTVNSSIGTISQAWCIQIDQRLPNGASSFLIGKIDGQGLVTPVERCSDYE